MDPPRVLIVDDEAELVSALVERLEIRGFAATGVMEPGQAIEHVRESAFDVAVVDLKMPGISGLEVIRRFQRYRPSLKCVLLTGHSAAENVELGRKSGAYECVMKPVNINVLIQILKEAARHG
jgi:DNA-binding NtrC family response regulator